MQRFGCVRRRDLAFAAMLVPAVFTLGWLVAGLFQENANVSRGTISDLGAETADKAWLWNVPLSVSGVLIIAFAAAVYGAFARTAGLVIAVLFLALFGLSQALGGIAFRRDCRSTEPACEDRADYSWHHDVHEALAGPGFLVLIVALLILMLRFRREAGWRPVWWYSLATLLAFVMLIVAFAARENEPGSGVIQRGLASIFFLWIGVVAHRLYTVEESPRRPTLSALDAKARSALRGAV
jgi:hypothetical protein